MLLKRTLCRLLSYYQLYVICIRFSKVHSLMWNIEIKFYKAVGEVRLMKTNYDSFHKLSCNIKQCVTEIVYVFEHSVFLAI